MNQRINRTVAYIAPQITDLGSHANFVQGTFLGGPDLDGVNVPCGPGFPPSCKTQLFSSPL